LEEERRLCFVGITRAQVHLILTKAAYRTIRGMRERTVTSPFLNEMPAEMLEITDRTGLAGVGEREEFRERFMDESDQLARQFRKGTVVRHPRFGMGRVEEVTNVGQHTRAVIIFNSHGRKPLILQYAQLEVVS
jgi:DNA helicase-2/ATP-dependent DNA helicase PcrA